jgi:hypothetical protein
MKVLIEFKNETYPLGSLTSWSKGMQEWMLNAKELETAILEKYSPEFLKDNLEDFTIKTIQGKLDIEVYYKDELVLQYKYKITQ